MDKLILYVKESYDELVNKVTWPTWENLLESTRLVLVASILITTIIFIVDLLSKQVTDFLYKL